MEGGGEGGGGEGGGEGGGGEGGGEGGGGEGGGLGERARQRQATELVQTTELECVLNLMFFGETSLTQPVGRPEVETTE